MGKCPRETFYVEIKADTAEIVPAKAHFGEPGSCSVRAAMGTDGNGWEADGRGYCLGKLSQKRLF